MDKDERTLFMESLAALMNEYSINEAHVRYGEMDVHFIRQPKEEKHVGIVGPHAFPMMTPGPVPVAAAPVPVPTSAVAPSQGHEITAMLVGTAYLSPEPGAPTFVTIGQTIKEGQPLLIIEAMKVMNTVRAPQEGRILDIRVRDGDPVEFGQVLMVLGPVD